jgi:UDP-galactopyranose mutase
MKDFLIVGTGLFGCSIAEQLSKKGYSCLIVDQRHHIGGNCYTYNEDNIIVHKYGPHIFHTQNKEVWKYINQFAEFNNFVLRIKSYHQGKIYSFPINLSTLQQVFQAKTPSEAKDIIEKVKKNIYNPQNFEESILSTVGQKLYEMFFKEYTAKQWGKDPKEMPAIMSKRVPFRTSFDDSYFGNEYQGIPIGGYTPLMEKMLEKVEVRLNCNFFFNKKELISEAKNIIFTGEIDQFYDCCFGKLEYRSLEFNSRRINVDDYQGCAVMNYPEKRFEYTRIIEHKHFEPKELPYTIITEEIPKERKELLNIPYYPVNTPKNSAIFQKYQDLAKKEQNVFFGGRLGSYSYLNMDQVILQAFALANKFSR